MNNTTPANPNDNCTHQVEESYTAQPATEPKRKICRACGRIRLWTSLELMETNILPRKPMGMV